MRNSFNFLLIALFFMDSCYLVGSITEAIRKSFNAATSLHLYMFPYFLYPCLSIAMTCSVFMTVAVALERYIAVHYPIDYSQAINSPEACRRRLFKYVIPVVIMAVFVNAPKFFESTVGEHAILTHPNTSMLQIGNGSVPIQVSDADITYIKRIEVTDLRKDPTYTIYYNNWTRLMLIGIVPFILLIYFNYKSFNYGPSEGHQGSLKTDKSPDSLGLYKMGISGAQSVSTSEKHKSKDNRKTHGH
eukprot:TCALIF_04580-PA protein Name:"Similar to FR FMRFamide receptor (Drosophila melanogaster)" AED:0.19 eAED:0.19 QI:25/0/0.5/0.5/1/1/2/0/244